MGPILYKMDSFQSCAEINMRLRASAGGQAGERARAGEIQIGEIEIGEIGEIQIAPNSWYQCLV